MRSQTIVLRCFAFLFCAGLLACGTEVPTGGGGVANAAGGRVPHNNNNNNNNNNCRCRDEHVTDRRNLRVRISGERGHSRRKRRRNRLGWQGRQSWIGRERGRLGHLGCRRAGDGWGSHWQRRGEWCIGRYLWNGGRWGHIGCGRPRRHVGYGRSGGRVGWDGHRRFVGNGWDRRDSRNRWNDRSRRKHRIGGSARSFPSVLLHGHEPHRVRDSSPGQRGLQRDRGARQRDQSGDDPRTGRAVADRATADRDGRWGVPPVHVHRECPGGGAQRVLRSGQGAQSLVRWDRPGAARCRVRGP